MHKRFFILLLICLLTTFKINGQATSYSLSFELGGVGGLGSFNLNKLFYSKKQCQLHWRAGFSLAPIDKNNGTTIVLPVLIHGQLGQSRHKLDIGVGQTLSITTKGNYFIMLPISLGYLNAPSTKKIWFRIAYTPIISYIIDRQYQHWGGLTIGYRLK
jgi:hypothetical protein